MVSGSYLLSLRSERRSKLMTVIINTKESKMVTENFNSFGSTLKKSLKK